MLYIKNYIQFGYSLRSEVMLTIVYVDIILCINCNMGRLRFELELPYTFIE